MKIKPLFDRVVLKPIASNKTTESGIMLPEALQEKSQIAEVVAVGQGGNFDGTETKMQVKVGDKVLYSKYGATEIKIEGEDLIVIRQIDILAIV